MGELLCDRYVLGEELGSGGMGRVVRAHDTRLDRPVAVKFLRDGADEVTRARMASEARLAGSLHHPGIAQVFDHDEVTSGSTTTPFIVMQLVEGTSLAQVLRDQGALPPAAVARMIADVADALHAAHEAGVVHRDLKPANIILTPAGRTVLVDFGIARSIGSDPLTDTGVMIGTADYLSPEQAAGRTATGASDLYSLGVVAHHCLTGQSPFHRESSVATALAHLHDAPPALETAGELAPLVADLLAKAPEDRPGSAREVADRASFLAGREYPSWSPRAARPADSLPATGPLPGVVTGTSAMPGPADTAIAATAATAAPVAPSRHRVRRLGVAVVAALVTVLALLAGGAVLSGDPEVPDVVGLEVSTAERVLEQAGFTAQIDRVDDPSVPVDEVVSQDPPAATVTDGKRVTLEVSTGKVTIRVEDLVDKPYAEAAAALESLRLTVVRKDTASRQAPGTVIAVDRSGRVTVGTTVTLTVARAPVPTAAPTTKQPPTTTSKPAGNEAGNDEDNDNGKAKGKGNGSGNPGKGKGKKKDD